MYKYISISKEMATNLLNVLLESVDEKFIFVFEKAMSFNFFDQPVLHDPDIQEAFVEIIKDRLTNKDKYYIMDKFKSNIKIMTMIKTGIERRNKNEINEISTMDYFTEKIQSLVVLKNAHNIVSAVSTADSNMSSGLIDEKDLNTIKSNLFGMLNDLNFNLDFGEMELEDYLKRERSRTINNEDKIIRTFSPSLDNILTGGSQPNKLYFISAPPGFGKSLALANMGYHALQQGKNVYFFSLEMGHDEVMQRFDCLISKKPMLDVINSPINVISENVKEFVKDNDCYLLIKDYPPETLTKEMLSMYLRRKIMINGKKPDIIIVDYADLMKSSGKNMERTRDLGLIYRQLKALSAEFGCPVWTASQINRAGFSAREADINNLSESWEKAMIADLVLVVRQTREEFEQQRLRLYVGKNRSGPARQEIRCTVNYNYMTIQEDEQPMVEDFSEVTFGETRIPLTRREETDIIFGEGG